MSNTDLTLPALLRHQATTQGEAPAFTFMDAAVLGTGRPESLTWNQLYRRVLSLAEELRRAATPGDRVAILAPQGLDYIVAFYAALQAGLIAVPLSVPMAGVHDQRVESSTPALVAVGLPPPSSRSTSSTWTSPAASTRPTIPATAPPICSTPRVRPGRRPASSSLTGT